MLKKYSAPKSELLNTLRNIIKFISIIIIPITALYLISAGVLNDFSRENLSKIIPETTYIILIYDSCWTIFTNKFSVICWCNKTC